MPPNTDLDRLRHQMATLQPGAIESMAETAAPFISKVVGYIELARAFMPRPARNAPLPPPRPVAAPAAPRVVVVVRRPWRNRMIGAGLTLLAGVACYGAWRARGLYLRPRPVTGIARI